MEYWDLEQAKLKKTGQPSWFAGEIALVTGTASGIGKACVDALLTHGAAVMGVDIDPAIETLYRRPDYLGLVGDVTSETRLEEVLTETADTFGGLDMLVLLNAGVFPGGCRIADIGSNECARPRPRPRRGRLLCLQGHPEPVGAGCGPRMGGRRNPDQLRSSQCGIRHRYLDGRGAGRKGCPLWPVGR